MLLSEVRCSHCGDGYEGRVQFKYGNAWQHIYRIGDKIEWGGNDVGKPRKRHVKVYGILENDICPACGLANEANEFDIQIENDIIVGMSKIQDVKDYSTGERDFVIIKE